MHKPLKYAVLIKQILEGQKDMFLDILQANAETISCYEVWKAAEARRKQLKMDALLGAPPAYLPPDVSGWIKIGAHTMLDKKRVESVGRILDVLLFKYPCILNIETFTPVHISCKSVYVTQGILCSEAITKIGADTSHYIKVRSAEGIDGDVYWKISTIANNRSRAIDYYPTEEEATKAILEVIEDECLL